jgi:hypothetical protein
MANNPVQVVLQTEQYMKTPENGGGGGTKDFYEGRDAEFARHKQRLLKQVDSIRTSLEASSHRQLGFVKVRLQSTALAKSHRPMEALFKPKNLPLVGSGALGELFFEVTPSTLEHVSGAIEKAELKVTKRDNKNKLKASSARSETGAIEDIALPTLKDKRGFGLDDAVRHFAKWPAARYFTVELFVDEASLSDAAEERVEARRALRAFRENLRGISPKLKIWSSSREWKALHVTTIQFSSELVRSGAYEQLLVKVMTFLDESALVRRYALGAGISRGSQASTTAAPPSRPRRALLPQPQAGISYPVVGIVDAGVSRHAAISRWSVGALDYMREPDSERDHGTFIAGLLVNGAAFNPGQPIEADPCCFFDFDLYSEDHSKLEDNFEQGFLGMMRQLDVQLSSVKPAGLRVINLSLNPEEMTDQNGYSPYAAILDQIADKHDVIFVISAGNLEGSKVRNRWPDSATPALQALVSYRPLGADRLYVPGETARNLTIGAFEPLDANGQTRPARYSRRGPATAAGIKPDFAHIGGCVAGGMPLRSIDHVCNLAPSEGTSYAAPLVAKTLALLDQRIEGQQPRELLLAMMFHFARMPALLDDKLLKDVCKDFAGFGMPGSVDSMLATDDTSITLVFQDTLPPGRELSFDFEWPEVLVDDGVTRGDVHLTIAYSPPVDRLHQAEFARVNLDAYLRQEQVDEETGEVSYKGRLKPDHPGTLEKSLITHGAKWWPVKHYGRKFSRLGGTSKWRLVVDSLTRAGSDYPKAGVRFAVVLTISDPAQKAPVFSSTRQSLLRGGVNLVDVRTAARVKAR